MTTDDLPTDIPALTAVLDGADHVDVKTVEQAGDNGTGPSLREFVAGSLGYRPGWLVALFAARAVVALLLRLRHPTPTGSSRPLRPADIDFTPGARVGFFTVAAGEEDRFLLLQAADTHLTGYLALVLDRPDADHQRYRAITVVRYHRFTGPLYFNVIRPFHHLVVAGMVRASAQVPRSRQAQNRNSRAPAPASAMFPPARSNS